MKLKIIILTINRFVVYFIITNSISVFDAHKFVIIVMKILYGVIIAVSYFTFMIVMVILNINIMFIIINVNSHVIMITIIMIVIVTVVVIIIVIVVVIIIKVILMIVRNLGVLILLMDYFNFFPIIL